MTKKLLSLVLTILLVFSLCACGQTQTSAPAAATAAPAAPAPAAETKPQEATAAPAAEAPKASEDPISLTVTGGPNGGVFYMLAAAWSQTFTNSNVTLNLETTAGSSENLKLVSAGEADFGLASAMDTNEAIQGIYGFEGNPVSNINIVAVGQVNTFHFVTLEGSGINCLADLKGKNVSVGPTGAPYFGPNVIEAATGYVAGEDYNPQWMSHDAACEALQNGDIDAIIAHTAIPTSAYSSLDATVDGVRFLGVQGEERDKVLEKYPANWIKLTVSKDCGYSSIKEDFETLGAPMIMFTSAEEDEESIYRLTKALFENLEASIEIYPVCGEYTLEKQAEQLEGFGFTIHPGALRYYKEVGIM